MPMIASAATAGNRNQNAGERGTKRKPPRGRGRIAPVAGGTVVLSMNLLRGGCPDWERSEAAPMRLAALALLKQRLLAVVIARLAQDLFRLVADRLRTVFHRDLSEHDLAAPFADHFRHCRPFRETRPIVRHAALPRFHHRLHEGKLLL